jgi:hypothetical protein
MISVNLIKRHRDSPFKKYCSDYPHRLIIPVPHHIRVEALK